MRVRHIQAANDTGMMQAADHAGSAVPKGLVELSPHLHPVMG